MSAYEFFSLAAVLLATACSSGGDSTGATDDAVTQGESNQCSNDGQYALRASGEGLTAHAGKTVAVSAVEPKLGVHAPAVVLSGSIGDDGRFELGCDRTLTENYQGPSYAVWLDQNGDGKCGAGDLAHTVRLFGWNFDLSISLDSSGQINAAGDLVPWGPADANWGTEGICSYFGFPR